MHIRRKPTLILLKQEFRNKKINFKTSIYFKWKRKQKQPMLFTTLDKIKPKNYIYSFGRVTVKIKNIYVVEYKNTKMKIFSTFELSENDWVRFFGFYDFVVNVVWVEKIFLDIDLMERCLEFLERVWFTWILAQFVSGIRSGQILMITN